MAETRMVRDHWALKNILSQVDWLWWSVSALQAVWPDPIPSLCRTSSPCRSFVVSNWWTRLPVCKALDLAMYLPGWLPASIHAHFKLLPPSPKSVFSNFRKYSCQVPVNPLSSSETAALGIHPLDAILFCVCAIQLTQRGVLLYRKVGDDETLMLTEVGGLPSGISWLASNKRVRTCDSSFHQSKYHIPKSVFYLWERSSWGWRLRIFLY